MKKLLLSLALCLATLTPVGAAGVLFLAQAPAASAFQGPGDIVSGATVFYSTNSCYNAAFTGKIMEVWDSATGSTDNTTVSCGTGGIITSSTSTGCTAGGATCQPLATTCAAACVVGTLYNQAGTTPCSTINTACPLAQTTNADRPTLVLSAVGGHPCAFDNNVSAVIMATGTLTSTISQPNLTLMGVLERTANFTSSQGRFFSVGTSVVNIGFNSSAGQLRVSAGTVLAASGFTDANPYVVIGIPNGASTVLVGNGSATTGAGGANNASGSISIMNDGSGTPSTGYFCEGGIWPVGMNATQYGNITTNARSRWGF